jgi:hypothetical protein
VDVEAAELLVLPFAADGEGAGRQPPERSANHGCGGGLGSSDPETLQAWRKGRVLFSLFLSAIRF